MPAPKGVERIGFGEAVVFSEPGELPATRTGGVVVFGRTSFCDAVRPSCGPPLTNKCECCENGGVNAGTDLHTSARRAGTDWPVTYPEKRCGCSTGADTTCSTCAADGPLEDPKCPNEADREPLESGKSRV